MDAIKLIARVKALLLAPTAEWPVIAREVDTAIDLYKNYILVIAAIPALAGFIRGSLIGYADQYLGTSRVEIGAAVSGIIVEYALTLASVYVLALVIDAIAPTFGAQRNLMQALKAAAYSHTASWVASAGILLPSALSFLLILLGAMYGVYLLYVGLPYTMKSSRQRAAGYAAAVIVVAIFLNLFIATMVRGVTRTRHIHHVVSIHAVSVTLAEDAADFEPSLVRHILPGTVFRHKSTSYIRDDIATVISSADK